MKRALNRKRGGLIAASTAFIALLVSYTVYEHLRTMIVVYLGIWVLGLVAIVSTCRGITRRQRQHLRTLAKLKDRGRQQAAVAELKEEMRGLRLEEAGLETEEHGPLADRGSRERRSSTHGGAFRRGDLPNREPSSLGGRRGGQVPNRDFGLWHPRIPEDLSGADNA